MKIFHQLLCAAALSLLAAPLYAQIYNVEKNYGKNQMVVALSDGTKLYYNTDEVQDVAINGNSLSISSVRGGEPDTFENTVAGISFSKAVKDQVVITEAKGWLESAYLTFNLLEGASSYNVYVKGGQYTDFTKIDNELVRNYGTYGRADIPGLKAADDYAVRVVPVDADGEEMTAAANEQDGISVKNFSRAGFSHLNHRGVGAYNDDGTLKSGALVLYLTAKNAKTVKAKLNSGEFTGIQHILCAYEKGNVTTPLDVRIVGMVSTADLDSPIADLHLDVTAIDQPSSLSIRVAREISTAAEGLPEKLLAGGGLASLLICSPPGGGKTTFLQTWQKYENRDLEGMAIATDPETPWHELMPEAPLMQLVADGPRLEEITKSLLRGDNDYILLEEMRDAAAFRLALDITSTGTMRSKATIHDNDAVSIPYRMASKIRERYGGDLNALIASDFVTKYVPFGFAKREEHYKLIDPFCLFYLHFVNCQRKANEQFWQQNVTSQQVAIWRGFAFENVCFNHIEPIKKALGISGVISSASAWSKRSEEESGAQIDLLIDRNDNVVNMCEMKFYSGDFAINKEYYKVLLHRQELLARETSPKTSIRSTLITTFGLVQNEYSGAFTNVVTLDDLFA